MTISALAIRNLRKIYANGFEAVRGVDLAIPEGEFFALLGPNGAGKSTIIGIIASLVRKSSGTVQVFGHDIDTQLTEAKRCIGLVPQEFNFNQFEPTAEIVVNQAGYYGIPRELAHQRAETYLRQLGLWDKRREMARQLSGGMKRRLMIARALVHEPKLLILDEPTAGVDIEIRRSMWDFLRTINARGTTIILTTHYLEEAESLCRQVAIIDQGRIIENAQMSTLLGQLALETFIFNVSQPLAGLPDVVGYPLRRLDDWTLEVDVSKGRGLNDLFKQLSAHGITISSLRNKANRLEELFMRLVDKNEAAA
ncbi:putative transport protein (ABC superfamily,atp_bind) [Candidatus Competibacter denitrificans Run_A_D11]|uniref:Transport protein (ABC superfamily,atp_bind) n=1 Tax=Candidatus Competibacter denitrificans Run_A_D11 TaxID=1400863 RepID=W6M860_9GAMM|nr:ABC transporter ATP-binding protein [Candidatus Competibacter denitrificans]CDI02834.1 putative transport protein (ABC superfamily,atp_bind) [Candidatus Competibacter denitrificans Run_A_D11]HRC69829.1 ABC transporter ATP-binding protein [Candidatus Competibacter denitrificans]